MLDASKLLPDFLLMQLNTCNLTELTTKSTCVPLEVSCVDTYAYLSEFGHDPHSL